MGFLLGVLLLMPSLCGFTWTPELDTIIREEAAAAGTPLDLAYALIGAESSFTAGQVTPEAPGGHSYGLLQLYDRGQGAGYPTATLLDPRSNLRIGLPYITRAFTQTWSPTIAPYEFIWLVSIRSGHPGNVPRNDYRIQRIARIWGCFFPAAGISGPLGAPSATVAPGPAAALAGGMPAIFILTLFPGGILRALIPTLTVHTQLRTAALALTPGGMVHRLQRAFDPIEMMPHRALMRLARPRVRLPARHRPARR